jgi:hypothetical protein
MVGVQEQERKQKEFRSNDKMTSSSRGLVLFSRPSPLMTRGSCSISEFHRCTVRSTLFAKIPLGPSKRVVQALFLLEVNCLRHIHLSSPFASHLYLQNNRRIAIPSHFILEFEPGLSEHPVVSRP